MNVSTITCLIVFVFAFVLFDLFGLFERLCRLNEDRSFSCVF